MTTFHAIGGAAEAPDLPSIRRISTRDVSDALRAGIDDFLAMPSHVVLLALLYPVIGLVIGRMTVGANAIHLVYPLVTGFALLGPIAGLPLYEMSRRRERGLEPSWPAAIAATARSPALPSIAILAVLLCAVFALWILTAQSLWKVIMGPVRPASVVAMLQDVFATDRGWALILVGDMVGLVFAAAVFSISVVSFPLLLDRDCGAGPAVLTSLRAVARNPGPMALWAVILAVVLFAGMLPLFVGLSVALPVLAHASWHLYRRVVVDARSTA
jgi:uncharacterized membrane protein